MLLNHFVIFQLVILWLFMVHAVTPPIQDCDIENIDGLIIDTTSCYMEINNTCNITGKITQYTFSNRLFNNGPYNYSACQFNFTDPIHIGSSADVQLLGRNSLVINSTENITISSMLSVRKPLRSPESDMWLGGFCSRSSLTQTFVSGSGPGGGRSKNHKCGNAGHGGMGYRFERNEGIQYGWRYGYNLTHVDLIGGSSGGLELPGSVVTCGGGAISISSNKNITLDANICASAFTSFNNVSSNTSCIGGSSGGTIIITANEVILGSNSFLSSKGTFARSKYGTKGSGSGGVIMINAAKIHGPNPDPHNNTGLVNSVGENGVVIINGESLGRFPKGLNAAEYAGCYRGNISIVNELLDYKVRPVSCKTRCGCMRRTYAILHEKTCVCLQNIDTLARVNETLCSLRCFGQYRYFCGGKNRTDMFYTVYKSKNGSTTCVGTSFSSITKQIVSWSPMARQTMPSNTMIKKITHSSPMTKQTTPYSSMTQQTTSSSPMIKQTTPSNPMTKQTTHPSPMAKQTISSSPMTKQTTSSGPMIKQTTSSGPMAKQTISSSPMTKLTTSCGPIIKQTTPSGPMTQQTTSSGPMTTQTTPSNPMTKQTTTSSPMTKQTTSSSLTTKQTTSSGPTVKPTTRDSIQALASESITKENYVGILKKLLDFLTGVVVIGPSELNSSLSIFETIIEQNVVSPNNVNESKHVGQLVLNIADVLLSDGYLQSWNNLEKDANKTPEIVLKQVEDIVKCLGSGLNVNETLNMNSTKFGVRIQVFDPLNFRERNYTISGLEIQERSANLMFGVTKRLESIFIPRTVVNSIKGTKPFSLNLLKYQPSSVLLKAPLQENSLANTSLVSDIIAVSLNQPLSEELKDDVILSFPGTKNGEMVSRRSCRFLDFSHRSKTAWSKEGCQTDVDMFGNTKCSYNHFTYFAVLLKVDNTKIGTVHIQTLEWISNVGCGISLLCLILTLITFLFLKNLTSKHTMIHCNLALSLTFAQIVFLLGIRATEQKIACKITAILLHYFYTVSFCWMAVEGIHLYRMVVKVFIKVNSKKLYYVFGWGAPAFLVAICALTNFDGYGNERACWLSIKSGLIWAFVGPVLIILLINLIILILVIRVTFVAINTIPSSGEASNVRTSIRGIMSLLPLLGLTWLFGVLAVNHATVVFQYIFTVLNSLQGFFIFMSYCVFNSEVRAALKRRQQKSTLRRSWYYDSRSKNKKISDQSKTPRFKMNNTRISPDLTVENIE